jgi:hypothetical protein
MEDRFQDVINFKFDYTWSFSTDDFIYARQIQALFSKQDFIDLGVDKEAVAFSKFVESEELCRISNERFEDSSSFNKDVSAVLYYASRKIDKILGPVPLLSELHFSFGPGATTSTNSIIANPRVKLNSSLECSTSLVSHVRELLEELPMLCDSHSITTNEFVWNIDVTIAPGKLSFVPKDCTKHRSIVVEPILNGLLQKGIGDYMKHRLKLHGLDLSDQTRNQKLARKGSIDGSLATIDLSMASDCISRGLVWSLLPSPWADLLDSARSDQVTYKHPISGEILNFVIEKFSSMGNAYTFELESLIFYSLVSGVCQHLRISPSDISVYGDDIICPVAAYPLLSQVLEDCGFVLNRNKTFSTGPFRESCGTDYLEGIDIRPFYLKTLISERTLYSMHNWFVRACEVNLAAFIKGETLEPLRIFGPDGYGDGHLIGDWNPRTSRKLKRAGYCGGIFDTYSLKPRYYKRLLNSDYVFPCYSIYVTEESDIRDDIRSSDPDIVRGTRGYHKLSIYTLTQSIFSGYG